MHFVEEPTGSPINADIENYTPGPLAGFVFGVLLSLVLWAMVGLATFILHLLGT